ncbi:TPA: polysaccharide deacetylase family protein [Candidatus Woesearchaeota archaeon]|nr:polysaccharide deacetylase family protein [Candidatus Woesearchaeota archaeon]HIH31775.1 polysaccharide deacetylase family protein [Candidatus Woesearchaeota archaeon]HIH54664.1 polysaccharide deacetylase family protein [Candidatus Woesearchaeota archaeon]HIJ01551.1 polysaccharide deacetylase family protein [Candidatus Woesearchaeota archaeon]HIJ13954.1 polysaccharide deacetylase family protein [Candidatus Woesearchaeota archaeon]
MLKKNIPAIFFCIGKNMAKYEDDLIYAINNGFIIGNHAFNHKHFSDLNLKDAYKEIRDTDKIIELLYLKAKIKRPIKVFRFPYLDKGAHLHSKDYRNNWMKYSNNEKKNKIQNYLKKLGYTRPLFENININWYNKSGLLKDVDVYCTFDQMEYFLGNEDAPYGLSGESAILARIEEDYPEEGRSLNFSKTSDIIMIHDHEKTTRLFFKLINAYLKKGIIFKLPRFKTFK